MQTQDITNKKIRLNIYKKALKSLEQNKCIAKLGIASGLCLLLPCIWLKSKDFIKPFVDQNHKQFSHNKTHTYFPEFAKYYKDKNDNIQNSYIFENWYRIQILKIIIEDMSK